MTEATPAQGATPKQLNAMFAGVIDQQAVQRLANMLSLATQNGVAEIHLMFQTSGGTVGDGVCLYNMFRSSPIDITLYNVGTISSAGVIAYLGAAHRKVSSKATFMIHKTTFSPVAANVERLHSAANAAAIDDKRIEEILHSGLKLPKDQWDIHAIADLWLSADEAVKAGLANGIADFAPPKGEHLYYVGAI